LEKEGLNLDNDPVTRTFRIENEYDEALREEAEKRGTSVNGLANQIFKKFTQSERYFGKGQSITLSPRTFESIISLIDEQGVKEAAINAGSFVPKDRLLMRGMSVNRESVLWFITDILGGYNDWFTCDIHERKNHTLLHIRHGFNKIWSLYLMYYLESMFKELLQKSGVKFDLTDNTLTLRLPK
jgi:hypothetical protein